MNYRYILGYRLGDDGLTAPAGEMYPVPDLVPIAPDRLWDQGA